MDLTPSASPSVANFTNLRACRRFSRPLTAASDEQSGNYQQTHAPGMRREVLTMKATVLQPTEIEVAFIRIEIAVRYGEEDIPNDFPMREGDMWRATVAMDNGEIQNWRAPRGFDGAEMYMKVCDCGTYTLLNHCGEEVAKIENDYVPHGVVPGEWGDYVKLQINAAGKIENWPKYPCLKDFFPEKD